jgi:hypothetical protein
LIAEDLIKKKKKKGKQKKSNMVATRTGAGNSTAAVEVVAMANNKAPVFSGKHGNDWTIWEMKMTAHLMDKGLDVCLGRILKANFQRKRLVHSKTMRKKPWN